MNYYKCGTPDDSKVDWESEGILGTKNLLKYPYYERTETENSVTFTDNGDGTITVSGTATANCYHVLAQRTYQPVLLTKGKYTVTVDNFVAGMHLLVTDSNNTQLLNLTSANMSGELTLTSDTNIGVTLTVDNGTAISSAITISPMIRLSANADDTYMAYVMTNKEITDRIQCPNNTDGTYVLKATVSSGRVTYSWVAE